MPEINVMEWEEAIEKCGSFFERARYLGLPKPPRCIVHCDVRSFTTHEILVMSDYQSLLVKAELRMSPESRLEYSQFLLSTIFKNT
jgi:hypothetical protein